MTPAALEFSGVVWIAGGIGEGKTTLLRRVERGVGAAGKSCAYVPVPTLDAESFVIWCLSCLGLPREGGLEELEAAASRGLWVLVDDADRLPKDSIELLATLGRQCNGSLVVVGTACEEAPEGLHADLELPLPEAQRILDALGVEPRVAPGPAPAEPVPALEGPSALEVDSVPEPAAEAGHAPGPERGDGQTPTELQEAPSRRPWRRGFAAAAALAGAAAVWLLWTQPPSPGSPPLTTGLQPPPLSRMHAPPAPPEMSPGNSRTPKRAPEQPLPGIEATPLAAQAQPSVGSAPTVEPELTDSAATSVQPEPTENAAPIVQPEPTENAAASVKAGPSPAAVPQTAVAATSPSAESLAPAREAPPSAAGDQVTRFAARPPEVAVPGQTPKPEQPPVAASPPATAERTLPAPPRAGPAPPRSAMAATRDLPPVSARGVTPDPGALTRVIVNAIPPALVRLDGRIVGGTPIADLDVAPGRYQFQAEFQDGSRVEREVRVEGDVLLLVFP